MVFSSTVFIFFFLPAALLLYYFIPARFVILRNGMLTLCSLVFYIWGEVLNVILLLAMLAVNYGIGKFMYRRGDPKIWLATGVSINLFGLFCYTKNHRNESKSL